MPTVNQHGHVTFSPTEIRDILKRRAVMELHTAGIIKREEADALHLRDDIVMVGTAQAGIAIAFPQEPVMVAPTDDGMGAELVGLGSVPGEVAARAMGLLK